MGGYRTNSGENLRKQWKVPAQQVRYHKNGVFFMPIDCFPAALCDPNGYVLINNQQELDDNDDIKVGERINIRCGICSLSSYIKVK